MSSPYSPPSAAPHSFCLGCDPGLVALQAGSDAVIALSFMSIALAMAWFVHRRRELPLRWLVVLTGACVLAGGIAHGLEVLTLRVPAYWPEGIAKALTAALSVITAVILWPLIPRALALPALADLQGANRQLALRVLDNDRASRFLQEGAARHRGIYERTPVPLHTMDVEGRLNGISDYWCELLGYAREDVIGQKLHDFCLPETADRLTRSLPILLEGGELRDVECIFRKKDGGLVEVLLSGRLERADAGRPLHIRGVLTDVTGRRQAERTLRLTEERLVQSQKMDAIGQLTGGIAHDFNNMLTVIDGNLEMLGRRLTQDPAGLPFVEAATRASGRTHRLTAQLLAFSRRQRLNPKPLHAEGVIDGMSSLLSDTVGLQIALRIDPRAEVRWSCLADRSQLEGALLNLVINAAQAVGEQGNIRITIRNTSLQGMDSPWFDESREGAVAPGDYVCLGVEDDGCGMSDVVRRRALEPFFTTRPIGQGTGLGLSQTYGFVRQSGGAMRIESRAGHGTVVEMLLPRALAAQSLPPLDLKPDIAVAARPMPGLETLLVVEDEPEVLEIAASSLRANGFEVICAPNAALALAALKANPLISLIFTDTVMPGINGAALAEEARRPRPGSPVVFASGYSDETITSQLPKGAMFLQKPYRIASVTKLIHSALAETQLSEV